MSRRLLVLLGVLSMIALIVGGCQNQPTVEEIVAKMREVEASTADAHGVLEFAVHNLGADEEVVVEVWEKRPDKTRIEMVESTDPELAGVLLVSDGEQTWTYVPADNRVLVAQVGPDEPSSPREIVQFMDEILERILDMCDVKLVGEEDVAGTATYKLEFTCGGENTFLPEGTKATVWVDQERWVVLQAHFSGGALGEGWMRVRTYELNTGLGDSVFQFEIPEGAEVTEMEEAEPVPVIPLTLDEARERAEFLMVPGYVPEGATLTDVVALEEAIVLVYDHSMTSFTIMQGPSPRPDENPLGKTKEVTVRGQPATLTTSAALGTSLLTWTENEITITVAGHIAEDEVLKVAESLQ